MTMTRQHFALIAEVIASERSMYKGPCKEAIDALADTMCRRLRATNPNFNPSRFLKACGVAEATHRLCKA